MPLSQAKQQEIINALSTKSMNYECSFCHQRHFVLQDGYTLFAMQDDVRGLQLGGRAMPVVMLLCNNCGYVMQFAIGSLGFSPDTGEQR